MIGEVFIRVAYRPISDYNLEMWRYATDLKHPSNNNNLPFDHFPGHSGFYYGVEIKTNSQGFRDHEYATSKPPGVTRIMMLGDSQTLGWGVSLEETASKRLERMLNEHGKHFEVINMGVGNYNSVMEFELFKAKGLAMDPDMVVLNYFVNDTEPTPCVSHNHLHALTDHSFLIAFFIDRYIRIRPWFGETFGWKPYYASLYGKGNSDGINQARKAIIDLGSLCREKGIRLVIINIPDLHKTSPYSFHDATAFIREIAEEEKVPFVDLLPKFASEQPEQFWVSAEDTHANGAAQSIIAEAIYGVIMETGNLKMSK